MMGSPPESQRRTTQRIFVAIDIAMIVLLVVNLTLISFDWLFSLGPIEIFLAERLPAFDQFYESVVHEHFLAIDLVFVAIFLIEFCVSWVVAISKKTYHRWFFYPFIHWYDLVGCIPLNAFRIVRLLRVFTIVYRLHRLGIVAIDQTYLYKKAKKYYEILLEEISDRVVENIINEMQTEVRHSGPTIESIVEDVLRPKQKIIVDWCSEQLAAAAKHNFQKRKREIREYVEVSIAQAFHKNEDVIRIEQIPIAGKALTGSLERAIVDIVYNIIESSMEDLASAKNRVVIEEATEIVLHAIEPDGEEGKPQELILDVLVEVLEIIKNQVSYTKRWKEKDLKERRQRRLDFLADEY